ncbi:rCG33722, isoform CRA_b [Rattus norvegicus]|uniref:RCG33722, isoform CRA_b n=1 Tax=Rattus norvegicus TaxID=10116 RepID=A6HHT8_RAT|nr:rCG33722, isoform CRA_b [Rattus norvegicus]
MLELWLWPPFFSYPLQLPQGQ